MWNGFIDTNNTFSNLHIGCQISRIHSTGNGKMKEENITTALTK